MQLHILKAKPRTTGSKGLNTQARANGNIPAVVYGGEKGSVSAMVDKKSLEKILHTEGGEHALIQLEFDEASDFNTPVIIKAVQHHPVSDKVLHLDFMRIRLDQLIQSPVSLVLTGRAKGVVDGGVIDQQLREVTVECLAIDMPEHIEIDITDLGLGESLHVSDLRVSEKITIVTDPELTIASIHAPRVMKTAEEEAAEATEAEAEEAKSAEE